MAANTTGDEPSTFGDLLRRHRAAAGLTQEALAQRAGLTPEAIGLLERGVRRRPHSYTVEHLADALGLTPDERAQFLAAAAPNAATKPARVLGRPTVAMPLTDLIGRAEDIARLTALVRGGQARLITLTGPGGVGKTHLAVQAAAELQAEYADGASVVLLAPVRDPALVIAATAQALDIGVIGSQALHESLVDALREKHLLLVLDNFEHVIGAAPAVADLLIACPQLTVLATSRSAIRVRGEHDVAVAPLALPDPNAADDVTQIERSPAVTLFVRRAQAVTPEFTLDASNVHIISQVCARLDGLPLAIELAAARIGFLPPRALLARLDRRLQVLTDGARDLPERQRTLRNAIAWSYDLLSSREQRLFRRLAVCVGGCTLEAAQEIGGDGNEDADTLSGLGALVAANLMRSDEQDDGEPRLMMLETIREYALERLAESDDHEEALLRHATHYLALAERAEPELRRPDQALWLNRLEAEHSNLRAVLRWSLDGDNRDVAARHAIGLRLAGALGTFWFRRGYLAEGQRCLEDLLAASAHDSNRYQRALRAKALKAASVLAFHRSDVAGAQEHGTAALALYEALGDVRGHAWSLLNYGSWPAEPRRIQQSRTALPKSLALFRQIGDLLGVAEALVQLGYLERVTSEADLGDTATTDARTIALYEEGLALFRQEGDLWNVAETLRLLGETVEPHDTERAATLYEQSGEVSREIGSKRGIGIALGLLAGLAFRQGQLERARTLHEESLPLRRESGDRFGLATSFQDLGDIARLCGDFQRAEQLLGEAMALWTATRNQFGESNVLLSLADVARRRGDTTVATTLASRSLAYFEGLDAGHGTAIALALLAASACMGGELERAAEWSAHSVACLEQGPTFDGVAAWVHTCAGDIARAHGDTVGAASHYARGLRRLGRWKGCQETATTLVEGLASLLAPGYPRPAARLFAACAGVRSALGIPVPPVRHDGYERDLAALRAALGADAFASAWSEGEVWPLGRTVAEALALQDR